MNGQHDREDELAALSRVLDAFGSDPSRWPAGAADRFQPLLAAVPAARALLAEARALERVLDRAPCPSRERLQGLTERIVAAAIAGRPEGARTPDSGGRVIALPVRIRQIGRAAAAADRTVWQAAALLAACLIAGVYLGASPTVAPVLQDFAESIGVAGEPDSASYAFFDDSLEEDTL
jgi:hypothetical protein